MIVRCKLCDIAVEGDKLYVEGQIVSHYKGSHGENVSLADFVDVNSIIKEPKVSHVETLETYTYTVEQPKEKKEKKSKKVK